MAGVLGGHHLGPATRSRPVGFRGVLGDAGLDLPADDWDRVWQRDYPGATGLGHPGPWTDWWAATADGMSAAQRDAVWDLLDQLRFHQVCELELRD